MVGVIWYRFVRYSGTDWSDALVPIHPLQWYRFADIITDFGQSDSPLQAAGEDALF